MRCAVILAGGSGTRLWPASRRARPKQLLAVTGDHSLLAATARRVRGACDQVMVVTAAAQAAASAAQVADAQVIAEPIGRNTAVALGLGAVHALRRHPDAVVGGFPADHHVADPAGFGAAIERAFTAAERDDVIATIGIRPDRAETGFGYLEVGGERADLGATVRDVVRFVEKPDPATAAAYLAGGGHWWNAGMFFVRARRLIAEIERWLPDTGAALAEIAAALAHGPAQAAAAAAACYPGLASISIDHGVMERTQGVVAVPGEFGWSDVGSWAAVAALHAADAGGNVLVGAGAVVDGGGNLIVTDDRTAVVTVGVSGLAVIRSGDAVLVVPLARAQDTRDAVAALRAAGLEQFT